MLKDRYGTVKISSYYIHEDAEMFESIADAFMGGMVMNVKYVPVERAYKYTMCHPEFDEVVGEEDNPPQYCLNIKTDENGKVYHTWFTRI